MSDAPRSLSEMRSAALGATAGAKACRNCGSKATVEYTRHRHGDTYRVHECRDCKARYETRETFHRQIDPPTGRFS